MIFVLENSRLTALDRLKHALGPVRTIPRSGSLPTFLASEPVSSADAASMAVWEAKTVIRRARVQSFSLCRNMFGLLPGSSYALHREPVMQAFLETLGREGDRPS